MIESWLASLVIRLLRWHWRKAYDVDFEVAYTSVKRLTRQYERDFYG